MQVDRAALPLVCHLHPEPEDIAELAFERVEVGIDCLRGIASAGATDVVAGSGTLLFAPRALFRLPYREPFRDDFARQFFGVRRGGNRSRVAHTDIALQ